MDYKKQSLVFTNENCIGCNKCTRVCSCEGACISKEVDGKVRVEVDPDRCVACGACFDANTMPENTMMTHNVSLMT